VSSLEAILQRHPVWRGALSRAGTAVPTGYAVLDRELPGGGWPAGALAEILVPGEGIGELQLALPALARLTSQGKRIAWLAPPYLPYAPALAAAGVRLEHLVVVRAPGRRDALWAAEQALQSRAFHALLAWPRRAAYGELRRVAVAAQANPAMVIVFRPAGVASEASPAALRLALEPDAGGVSVRILKRRAGAAAAPLRLPIERPLHAVGGSPPPRVAIAGARARACVA
jgi:cell division inhibitor SulA/protein ImuA